MKKTIAAITISFLFITGSLMAQSQLYFGIAGSGLGTVITNQNNYGLPFEMDYAFTMGGSGNVNVGFDFNKNLGLKLEIGWAKLGQKYEDTYWDTIYTRNVKLNYLQIPLMFKFRAGGEVAKFYVMAGPQFNILLSASQEYYKHDSIFTNNGYPNWNKPTLIGESDIKERYNTLDIMARIDLGVDINFTKNLFMNVGLTMAYGLMDINATDFQNPLNTPGYEYNASHNLYGGINVGINYVLPFSKAK
jgi:hypothetical protein